MNIIKRVRRNNGKEPLSGDGQQRGITQLTQEVHHALNRIRQFFDEPLALAGDLIPWPAVDVTEDEKAVTLRVDVPGMSAKDIEIDVSGNLLSIRGWREEEKKGKESGVWRHERHTGSFVRSVTLPNYVDPQKVDARYDKGVLTVTAAKVPGAGPKRVPVKS